MSQTDARNVDEIRRDAERARANLTDTVQQLRDSVSGAASDVRQRLSPNAIKDDLVDTAMRNPLQAAAVGALVAWPAIRLVRSIPLPVLMIGAGLFLTGSKKGQELSRKAADHASDLAEQARRKAHDLTDAATDTAEDIAERAARAAEDLRRKAQDTAEDASNAVSDAAARATSMISGGASHAGVSDAADALGTAAQDAMGAATDALRSARSSAMSSAEDMLAWAKENPILVAGLGVVAGGFIASALPPTDVERNVASTVSGAVRGAARQGASAAMGVAATAAFDMARQAREEGLDPDKLGDVAHEYGERASKVAEATVDAALGKPSQVAQQQFKSGEQI